MAPRRSPAVNDRKAQTPRAPPGRAPAGEASAGHSGYGKSRESEAGYDARVFGSPDCLNAATRNLAGVEHESGGDEQRDDPGQVE
jgi:hypothetical protein